MFDMMATRCIPKRLLRGSGLGFLLAFVFAGLLFSPSDTLAQTTLTEQQKILAADIASGDQFGNAVDIDGTTAIIGSQSDGITGAAYIYRFEEGAWTQSAKLTPSQTSSGQAFGNSAAIYQDLAVIGAPGEDWVYIFRFDGTQWNEEVRLIGGNNSLLGTDVDVRDNVVVAGDSQDRVTVYRYDGFIWAQEAVLTDADATTVDFGEALSLGDDVLLVGARTDDTATSNAGAAYVFRYDGTNWSEEAVLTASDAQANDFFGTSVSLDASVALVGAPTEDGGAGDPFTSAGAAYVFRFDGSQWTEEAKLTALDARTGDDFGLSVSVSGDGIAVGAPGKFVAGSGNSGAAYVYQFDGAQWTQEARLFASDAAGNDQFGSSISIDRSATLIGAPLEDDGGLTAGAVYGFGPTIAVNAPTEAAAGSAFPVTVTVGSAAFPVVDLLGAGYRLSYDDTRFEVSSADAGAFVDDGDLVDDSFIENPLGFTSIGTFRKGSTGTPLNGSGVFTTLNSQIPTGAVVGSNASLALSEVLGIDDVGAPVVLFPVGDVLTVADPNVLFVWPGDTNNSGSINETAPAVDLDDVQPVANCFDLTGPARSGPFDITWGPKEADPYTFPSDGGLCEPSATFLNPVYADATGDGTINQNDLSAVGLNFGQARVDGPVTSAPTTLLAVAPEMLPPPSGPFEALELPPLEQGAAYPLRIELTEPVEDLRGVVASLEVPPGLFRVEQSVAGRLIDDNDLVSLDRYDADTGALGLAASRKRASPSVTGTGPLVDLTLVATRSTQAPVTVEIAELRVHALGTGQIGLDASTARLVGPGGAVTPIERTFGLDPIAPNPVRDAATLRFALPETAPVRLAVYDVLGREVRVLVDRTMNAGPQTASVDAARLAPGLYFVRLTAGADTATRKLTVVR